MYKYVAIFILSLVVQSGWSQEVTIQKLLNYPIRANNFTKTYPHEKVYLHMDNRSYFLDETLWYKAYVVNSDSNKLTKASEILHIELLTPEGAVIRTQKHRLKAGQCHGYITLDSALYSGYFEIRAYTKAMLNFDEQNYFSRVFPLFEKPKKLGTYDSIRRTRPRHRTVGYPEERTEKEEKNTPYYSIHFYPEGGNLVANLKSTIAFQIKDRYGEIVNTKCDLYDNKNVLIDSFSSTHLGMGTFQLIPKITRKGYYLKIQDDFKDSQYPLPTVFEQGHTLIVDNLSDSLKLKVRIESTKLDDTLGVVVLSRGRVGSISIIAPRTEKPIHELSLSKSNLREGVNQVVIYDKDGRELASRMIFIQKHNSANILTIKATPQTNTSSLKPYERQEILFKISDNKGLPIATNFSLSIYDSISHISTFCNDNIYTNLLLSSEVKGFIPNVEYYFESKDAVRERNLDLLLMVNGWSRYKWEYLSGYQKIDLKYFWEKELAIYGREYYQICLEFLEYSTFIPGVDKETYPRMFYQPTDDIGILLAPNKLSLLNIHNDSILYNKHNHFLEKYLNEERRISDRDTVEPFFYPYAYKVSNYQDMSPHKELSFSYLQKNRNEQFYMSFEDFYGETKLWLSRVKVQGYSKIKIVSSAVSGPSDMYTIISKPFFLMESEVSPQEKKYDFFEININREKSASYALINGEYIKQYSLNDINVYAQNNLCFHPSIKTNYYNQGFYNQLFVPFFVPILDRINSKRFNSLREYKKSYDIKKTYPYRADFNQISFPNEYLNYYKLPLGTIAFIANTTVDTSDVEGDQNYFTIPLKHDAPDVQDYNLDTSKYTYFIDSTIIHTNYGKREEIHKKFQDHCNYTQYKVENIKIRPKSTTPKQLPNYIVEHFCRIIKRKSFIHTRVLIDNQTPKLIHARKDFYNDPFLDKYNHRLWHTMHVHERRIEIFQGLTHLEKEFYSPDYSKTALPSHGDYRRTLYWNPNIQTDSNGQVLVEFYNNSSCNAYLIDAQTITKKGTMGVINR